MVLVVGATEEADIIEVTTLAEPSTVVVESCTCVADVVAAAAAADEVIAEDLEEAMEEDISEAIEEDTEATLLEAADVLVTAAELSDILQTRNDE